MAVAERPFHVVRQRWLAIVLTGIVSALVWLLVRDQITALLRLLAHLLVALVGERTYDHSPAALTIIVGSAADSALVRGTMLERWHVNLIALPILAVAFGPSAWRRRLVLGAAGLALVLLCDALSAIGFVALQGWGATGEVTIGASLEPAQRQAIRRMAMQGLAVYGSKLTPLAVWGVLYWGFIAAEDRVVAPRRPV